MKSILPLLLFILAIGISAVSYSCPFDGNQTNAGALSPTAAYQTQGGVSSGDYFSISVNCGDTYNFNFCNNGGSASWDTQITILQTDGTTQIAYNDDNCGLQSNVSFTATFTGTVYVLVSLYSCNNTGGSTGATLAYNVVATTPSDASFTMSSTGCSTASANITGDTGGTFSLNAPIPGSAVINPSTGEITNGNAGATYNVEYTVSCGVNTTQNVTLDNSGTPTFTMTVACGGGTATITGSTGGTFAFNPLPLPGDGAQINTANGSVTNGTAGTTYFVEYTVCGSSSIESVTVLTDNCWTLNGNSQWITVGGEQCIQLTAAVNGQLGCSWNGSQIDFLSDFSLTLDYYFGNNINGADGNTFTFQPSGSTACGTAGGQLGAGGIPNALVVEFDTYDNDNPTHLYDMSCDHIAVEIDGNMQNAAPLCGPVCAKAGGGNIDDGGTYTVDMVWDSGTNTLDIYFNGNLRLSCTNDFITNAFGGASSVYWGVTSATGGLNNQQYFCPSTVIILPAEMSSFSTSCDGITEVFDWTTESENRVDYFTLEYSQDGMVFYPIEVIDAVGLSTTEINYRSTITSLDPKHRYYRLKITDEDGEFEYTDMISGKGCATAGESLISSIANKEKLLTVSLYEDAHCTLINQLGQSIVSGTSTNQQVQVYTNGLSSGIYFLKVEVDGRVETKKIYIK
ncbi:MAG: hypothetical protein ACI865_002873 [Flavobacteriaceae bacterium]|jgi:hypothetical protein